LKTWVITGGAGFIGGHAASTLHARGDRVVLADDLSRPGSAANLAWLRGQGIDEFHQLDIRDPSSVDSLISRHADADAVLHLAGQVAVTSSVRDPRADFEANALGTLNVLEAVRTRAGGRPAVLYSSTNKVYGGLEDLAIVERDGRYALGDLPGGVDESRPLDFHSPYGCSKGAGDQYVRDYARIYGMKTITFRQSCIYGTRQNGVEDQGWVAWFCIAAASGRPVTVCGDGKQVRDLLWVDDLVDIYIKALDRIDEVSGEAFNVGGGPANALSINELVALLGLEARRAPWRPGDQRVFVADVSKARRRLGWSPSVGAAEGVARLRAWASGR